MRPIRIVTLNLWNDCGDAPRRLAVAVEALYSLAPDVVALQEAVISRTPVGDQVAQIADRLGASVFFDPVDSARERGVLGNAIVSRFPIRASRAVALPSALDDPRRAALCLLEAPAGLLPCVTCHLSWPMYMSPRREAQIVAVDDLVREHPGDLPAIVCGDFNASPDTDVVRFLTGRASLHGRGTYYRDTFARRFPHADGHTWSERNPYAVRSLERNRRIDYVFVGPLSEDGWGAVLDARVVLDLPGPDGVFASDHFGVYAEIGRAPVNEAL